MLTRIATYILHRRGFVVIRRSEHGELVGKVRELERDNNRLIAQAAAAVLSASQTIGKRRRVG